MSGSTARPRLYVAHTGADRIDVIDCRREGSSFARRPSRRRRRPDRRGARPPVHLGPCRRALSVFRASDATLLGQVVVAAYPNGLAYDRRRRRLYSFNVGAVRSASVVDVDSLQTIAEVALPGRPRWALYDEERDVVYANIRSRRDRRIEAERTEIGDAFAVPSAGPHGLGLDGRRLFCAADGGELVVLDRESGDVLPSSISRSSRRRDARLRSRRLFVAIGDPGLVCAFEMTVSSGSRPSRPSRARTRSAGTQRPEPVRFCPQSCGALVFEERG